MGLVRTRVYEHGDLVADDIPVADLSEVLKRPGSMLWVDLEMPDRDELERVAEELGFHELAVEDALEPHQRPKLDRYRDHLFLSCHRVATAGEGTELSVAEIDTFIGHRWIVTVRQDTRPLADDLRRRWDRDPQLARNGVGFLLWGLLDLVVDEYFDAVQTFDDYYDEVMDRIFADEPIELSRQRDWYVARRSLLRFHRFVAPLREAVGSLMRGDEGIVPDRMIPYFQDIYDHILRVGEATDSLREIAAGVVEANLSLRDYRQNQIMKKVTSWAAIIAVPTLVTGFYGMNVPFWGNGRPAGVAWAAALMIASSLILYTVFKVRDWL